MSTVSIGPLRHYHSVRENPGCGLKSKAFKPCSLNYCSQPSASTLVFHARSFCNFRLPKKHQAIRATSTTDANLVQTFESAELFFKETFPLKRTETVRILLLHFLLFFFCLVSVWFSRKCWKGKRTCEEHET